MKRLILMLATSSIALAALPSSRVAFNEEGEYRIITSNGLPDHSPGIFPRKGNPNTITAQSYAFRVPLKPVI
ncbi:MAG: hypothetical protein JWO94_1002, partial [Verrucomicrobiaceae bacterium]|nr:hypothetical protein [Verrucomicrobiaceae bacterium]